MFTKIGAFFLSLALFFSGVGIGDVIPWLDVIPDMVEMGIDYISIGNRIKEIRTAKGWTQAKLAEESGVEPSNISHIERAATKLSLPTLVNIANALGVTLDEIAYGSLVKSSHVSIKMIDEILADCSPDELKSIAEVIRTTKSVLKNK